jgi:Glycosyltransferase family 92
MNLALCSIQKNRGPWLAEWVVFHVMVGVQKFYLYLHGCSDQSLLVATELTRHFDLEVVVIPGDVVAPQLKAYHHCYSTHGHKHDWLGFIDGDEFLFSPAEMDLKEVLAQYRYGKLSALGVYWATFGSSHHEKEPSGLIIENYTKRAHQQFEVNTHIKSVVMGRQGPHCLPVTSHHFKSIHGTYDTSGRLIEWGYTKNNPDYSQLRINHYVTQSLEYFTKTKSVAGKADVSPRSNRDMAWFDAHNRNEVDDDSMRPFSLKVKESLVNLGLFNKHPYVAPLA